ncbi:hypothetical protein [Enhygromyxa salina]|uniref:hypothetical protein n=1 Tax=Enhygromyxa salina TaxID=215803 RepID=UPI0015E79C86|nr:hypothetical protein [Enhygromyxa salina]
MLLLPMAIACSVDATDSDGLTFNGEGASAAGTTGDGDGDTADQGDGDADQGDGDGDPAGDGDADADGGTIFDVIPEDTGDGDVGECCGEAEFSYIWIANSSQSTVSKVNTRTMMEEGRYLTKADANGNPSRTSVSVDGRAVAVANRRGGIIKIWARADDCAGPNTSTGPNDVKPWGQDDCVAWYTDFPQAASQRPVAWTTGVMDEVTCEWSDQKIWTAEGRGGNGGAFCSDDRIYVHRLDGDTGEIEDTIELMYPCTTFGVYGGVVDANNDFWITRLFEGSPGGLRIDFDTLTHTEMGSFYGYGIAVDHQGKIWGGTGVPGKWDPNLNSWTSINGSIMNSGVGLAEDKQGRMWVGINGGIQAFDAESMAFGPQVLFPNETIQSKGISVDVDGYIWAIPDNQSRAYRVDPDDLSFQSISGFVGAYTYSDMTGGSLYNVACNPPA